MNNQSDTSHDTNHKDEIALPLIALGLDLLPVPLIFLSSLGLGMASLVSLLIILSPIAGLITGISALSRGKARIGLSGKILAIIAVSLPLAAAVFIIIFFIGAATGMIPLM